MQVYKVQIGTFPVRIKFNNGTQRLTVEAAKELARELDKVTGVTRQPDSGAFRRGDDDGWSSEGYVPVYVRPPVPSQPVPTGEPVGWIWDFAGGTHFRTESPDTFPESHRDLLRPVYLSPHPPVPSVVGVPDFDELMSIAMALSFSKVRNSENAMLWMRTTVRAIHAHLLAHRPDMGAVVEALEDLFIETMTGFQDNKIKPRDELTLIHRWEQITGKDYLDRRAAIKEGVR